MLATLNRSRPARVATGLYVAAFFAYLFAPLLTVALFSFNDSTFPSPPWQGFTIDWYISADGARLGLLHDARLLESVYVSLKVALAVALLSVVVGTCNAFLLARQDMRFRETLYMMMLWPLVVPGVILGIAILVFTNGVASRLEDWLGWEAEWLRPGTTLVILGQFSFIATVATLVISARLKKFNPSLEEAALSLGASRIVAVATVTLPFLKPAMIGAGIVAFLMSFENFNTTLMLVGSDATLPVAMYARLRQGSTPVLNAISVMLILASALLALAMVLLARQDGGSDRS
ncbi:MAG TPA: ABC transporter permease [Alphaproteobacteria bacterium]|nr:ABC transporter permease [Alphaproteobacteria bacterium]